MNAEMETNASQPPAQGHVEKSPPPRLSAPFQAELPHHVLLLRSTWCLNWDRPNDDPVIRETYFPKDAVSDFPQVKDISDS